MNFFARRYAFKERDEPIIIGEVGVNHNGDPQLARRLVDVAVESGVQVVKFQAFKTENEISRFAELAPYQQTSSPDVKGQFDLCKELELPPAEFRELKDYCIARGIGFLCSVFDIESLDYLVSDVKIEAVKIASGEVTNFPFLENIGKLGLSVILSTGACTLEEVESAVNVLKAAGCPELVLLHCVTSYPAPAGQLNLRAIETLKRKFSVPVGFSDHSEGLTAAIAATALGAVAIEKHFTLDKKMDGPDHQASIEPAVLTDLVNAVSATHRMLGDGVKRPVACEMENLPLIRRSLVARGKLKSGEILTREKIEIKRPSSGIQPKELSKAVGRTLLRDVLDDEPITWDMLAK